MAASTACGLETTSSAPPRAGPANDPMPSTALATTFAAVSSSGVRVTDGSSADCAGMNAEDATADRPTASSTSAGASPADIASAASASAAARSRSESTITRRRDARSASAPANGAETAPGASRTNVAAPARAAPPSA